MGSAAAAVIQPAIEEFTRQTAQGGGLHPEEISVLQDWEGSAGRRRVHEPDPHLRIKRRTGITIPMMKGGSPSMTKALITIG
jgi:hypothetical protein